MTCNPKRASPYWSAKETDHMMSKSGTSSACTSETSAKCDINCWLWHHFSSLVTVPTREVYFGAALLSLASGCHISPRVTTDLLRHTLQADGVSQRMKEETTNIYRLHKREKNLLHQTELANWLTELPGYLCKENVIETHKMQGVCNLYITVQLNLICLWR